MKEDIESNSERIKWRNKGEYMLSAIGYAIGLSNVYRFPYLCYQYGGGAFLVACITILIFCGLPLFFMETSLGQFSSKGCIKIFEMCPLFKGVGFAIITVSFIQIIVYNMLLSYALLFLYNCFQPNLPWASCNNTWNTAGCAEITNMYDGFSTESKDFKSSSDEFFHKNILQISSGIESLGSIVTPVLIANIITWTIMCLCVIKGIRSVGKVVYVTATMPFIIIFALFVRAVTLPGAWNGIRFYIYPQWDHLTKLETWGVAAAQVFSSLGPGWGALINMSSHVNFKNNNKRDSILVPITNDMMSIFSGFVVFSVLGYMSHQTGLAVSDVASGGLSLAYITYPQAVSLLPLSHLWAVLFFFMFFFLGLDTCFALYENIIASLVDIMPRLKKWETYLYIGIAFVMFLLSLICTTNGGMYILQLVDWYSGTFPVLYICFLEAVMVGWIYGANKFARDIEFMIGEKVHWWWLISWKIFSPVILLFIFIITLVFSSTVTYDDFIYPQWTIVLGWLFCCVSLFWIPTYAVHKMLSTSGSFMKRLKSNLMMTEKWGPASSNQRKLWLDYKQKK